MKNLILSSILFVSFLSGCKKSESECEKVFAHTVSLMPAEMKDKVEQGKSDAIAKCEKMSPATRTCALDAKSLEDLMKCPRS